MPPAMAKEIDWIEVPFRVLKEHEGRRLDAFLAERLGKKYSRMAVQKLIDDGLVSRAVRPVKASARVESCSKIKNTSSCARAMYACADDKFSLSRAAISRNTMSPCA